MSIITTFSAVPSRLLGIYAALYESDDGEVRKEFEACSTPPSLAPGSGGDEDEARSSLFNGALQEALRLGIVEEQHGRLRIAATSGAGKKRQGDSEAEFRTAICKVLFDPLRAQEAGNGAFMLALSWFLSKNPLLPLDFSEEPQLRVDLGEENRYKTELTNQARYQNFLYWARYLGFATFVGVDSERRRVFPDPVRAIAGILPRIFGDAQILEIETFLSVLSDEFPVFEGGVVRGELERMRTEPADDEDRLSVTTSLALRRLADRREISLEAIADAHGKILNFGIRTERVSRIRRGGIQ